MFSISLQSLFDSRSTSFGKLWQSSHCANHSGFPSSNCLNPSINLLGGSIWGCIIPCFPSLISFFSNDISSLNSDITILRMLIWWVITIMCTNKFGGFFWWFWSFILWPCFRQHTDTAFEKFLIFSGHPRIDSIIGFFVRSDCNKIENKSELSHSSYCYRNKVKDGLGVPGLRGQ